MATERAKRGYLHPDSIKYANGGLFHYRKAIRSTDMYNEEVEYQRVFHDKSSGENIAKEVFQRSTRNKIYAKSSQDISHIVVTNDTTIEGTVQSKETRKGPANRLWVEQDGTSYISNKTTIVSKSTIPIDTPEESIMVPLMIETIFNKLDDTQKLVFAYILVTTRMDEHANYDRLPELKEYTDKIIENNAFTKGGLHTLVGTRYKADKAWSELMKIVSDIFGR